MSEIVDRVARALCRQYEIDDGFSVEQADRAAASEMHRNFQAAARAAVAALREPTDAMILAGMTEQSCTLADEWRAMIDEALK